MPRSTLSVAIITLNEAGNLPRTLASVRFADEIVIVDSGSTDATVEIATRAGAKVFTEAWKGFALQKNFAIDKCNSTWILSLDADEELTEELQAEIRRMLETDEREASPVDGYWLRLRHIFLGRWMRYGDYYPDMKLRLFRRVTSSGPAHFTVRPVHESVQVAGRVETMQNDFLHHGYPNLDLYLEHMNRYSTLGARLLAEKGRTSRSWPAFFWNTALVPVLTFVWNYVFRLGFLDGREGLLLHLYHSGYVSWKYAKAWQIGKANLTKTTSEHE
jgi:glycosyltransferase involved in cell wall biosynthesis